MEPGQYIILGLTSWGQSMSITGDFFTALDYNLTVPANTPGISYLGHIDATVRARKEGEFRATLKLPTQEQRITGSFTGTFDVATTDAWETDREKFKTKFPSLKEAQVTKAVLPPFNRERVQRWWDTNGFAELP